MITFCEDDLPLVIVLYRKNIPDYSDVTAQDDKRFMYTDIDTPNFSTLKTQLLDKLKRR